MLSTGLFQGYSGSKQGSEGGKVCQDEETTYVKEKMDVGKHA